MPLIQDGVIRGDKDLSGELYILRAANINAGFLRIIKLPETFQTRIPLFFLKCKWWTTFIKELG